MESGVDERDDKQCAVVDEVTCRQKCIRRLQKKHLQSDNLEKNCKPYQSLIVTQQ